MPESSAGDAAVAQRAPVEHQAGTAWPAFHAAAYVHLELKKCCGFLELQVTTTLTSISDQNKLLVVYPVRD